MNKINGLIINNNKVMYIGYDMLRFIDRRKNDLLGFPGGKLSKGDLVIFISSDLQQLADDDRLTLDILAGSHINDESSCMLIVSIYDSPEIHPVIKHGNSLFSDTGILLDTCIDGCSIKISFDRSSNSICVNADGSIFDVPLKGDYPLIICYNSLGLKYTNVMAEVTSDPLAILNGDSFDGYIDEKRINAQPLIDDIFPADFCSILRSLNKASGQKIINYNGKRFLVESENVQISNMNVRTVSFSSAGDILAKLDSLTGDYRELVRPVSMTSDMLTSGFQLFGGSESITRINTLLQKSSMTNITILLTGESGTGKTFMAQKIHNNSTRSGNSFIHVNCAAIPYNLIESELFGYEDGAFTGAKKGGKQGYFEMAENGTLFLDEITELPITLQGKLLEVIQNKTYYRVGGSNKLSTNARLIFATNRDLKKLVSENKFREDLYYRINVFPIELPPLRERKDVIWDIAYTLLPMICAQVEVEPLIISSPAMTKIMSYNWPGNIRELENVLAKAAIMCNGKTILPEDIEIDVPDTSSPTDGSSANSLHYRAEEFEKQIISEALSMFNGEKQKTADYLGISRTSLFLKIKKYCLDDSQSENTSKEIEQDDTK
jgi:transcriptional regulator with PAS, ATPase and Fis domain